MRTPRAVTPTPLLLLFAGLLSLPASLLAEVRGQVKTAAGVPVESARVEEVESGEVTATDARGHFVLEGAEAPLLLLVRHPRFEDHALELTAPPAEPLSIVLAPKQVLFEQIVVSARRGGDSLAPSSIASTLVEPARTGAPPTTLTDAISQVAGVSENGQGGLFQVVSIRGVSRNRVLTLVDGVRIITERRAGSATSFIDPLLVGSVDVLRGPASTFYGSGALGGVLQVFPTSGADPWLAAGYDTNGDEHYLAGGWSADGWSVGVARRSADNSEAADGSELASGFDQVSATLSKRWEGTGSGRIYELSLLPSIGRDIQKSSTDFPSRPTVYPQENHLLARFGVTTEDGWNLSLFAHPNDLETRTTRPGDRINTVENEAFDFGFNAVREVELAPWRATARFGLEYFGRRGVSARETEIDLDGIAPTDLLETLDGREDEVAAYGSLRRRFGKANVEIGGRLSRLEQDNAGAAARTDTAFSAFAGATMPLGAKGLELAANLGTGLRFPSLSERFFTGTTGRGGVIGNPDLDSERSLNADLALRWYGKRLFLAGSLFRNEIDDYIERVEISPDLLSFVNLTSGRIDGVEAEGFFQATERWRFSWDAHHLRGRADDGTPLADIPVDRLRIGLRHERGPWALDSSLDLRSGKDDPGNGEAVIDSAQLLSAAVTHRFADRVSLVLSGANLLDAEYRRSADDKAPLAPGRTFALGLRLGL